jgi:hypothetical protein
MERKRPNRECELHGQFGPVLSERISPSVGRLMRRASHVLRHSRDSDTPDTLHLTASFPVGEVGRSECVTVPISVRFGVALRATQTSTRFRYGRLSGPRDQRCWITEGVTQATKVLPSVRQVLTKTEKLFHLPHTREAVASRCITSSGRPSIRSGRFAGSRPTRAAASTVPASSCAMSFTKESRC